MVEASLSQDDVAALLASHWWWKLSSLFSGDLREAWQTGEGGRMNCHQGHRVRAYLGRTVYPPRGHPCHRERAVLQGNLWCANATEWQLLKTSQIPIPCRHRGIKATKPIFPTGVPTVCQACSAFWSSFCKNYHFLSSAQLPSSCEHTSTNISALS